MDCSAPRPTLPPENTPPWLIRRKCTNPIQRHIRFLLTNRFATFTRGYAPIEGDLRTVIAQLLARELLRSDMGLYQGLFNLLKTAARARVPWNCLARCRVDWAKRELARAAARISATSFKVHSNLSPNSTEILLASQAAHHRPPAATNWQRSPPDRSPPKTARAQFRFRCYASPAHGKDRPPQRTPFHERRPI